MATIWDVAKLAGVSKSTVSRVMNNGSSSDEARNAVLDAIKKLNYQPSCFAKNIRTQKSMTIALMIPDASNFFYTEMFKAIEQVAYEREYMVILCDTQSSTDAEIAYAEKLLQRRIDGLIYCTYKMDKAAQNYFLALSSKLPVVFADYSFRIYDNISLVATEGYSSSRNGVRFLYHKGCRRIAYINFPKDVHVTYHRYEGYLKGLEDCGLASNPELVYFPPCEHIMSARDMGFNGAKHLFSTGGQVDAIMAAADPIAMGAVKYLKYQGIRIPGEIRVIGFDNNEFCEVIDPPLTTIAQPISRIGTTAAQILFNKIAGNTAEERVFFDGELIQRDST
jgi:DNA-binding LacI/PurR family transcriptional regulator